MIIKINRRDGEYFDDKGNRADLCKCVYLGGSKRKLREDTERQLFSDRFEAASIATDAGHQIRTEINTIVYYTVEHGLLKVYVPEEQFIFS